MLICSQVFVHQPEDIFWLVGITFPYPVTSFYLSTKSDDDLRGADLYIEQVDTIQVSKKSKPCKNDMR